MRFFSIFALVAALCASAPSAGAPKTIRLGSWSPGSRIGVTECDGAVGIVYESLDIIRLVRVGGSQIIALEKGAKPRDVVRAMNGDCYILEGGANDIAVEHGGSIIARLRITAPLPGPPVSLSDAAIAGSRDHLYVTVPDVQAIVDIDAGGRQNVIGTAFGDYPKELIGWYGQRQIAPIFASSSGWNAAIYSLLGEVVVDNSGALWIARYGNEVFETEILRYSATTGIFSAFALRGLGVQNAGVSNLVFPNPYVVAYTSVDRNGLYFNTLSPFGEVASMKLNDHKLPSRSAFSVSTLAIDSEKRVWVVDPDLRKVYVIKNGRVQCAKGGWRDPFDVFGLSSSLFAVVDVAARSINFVDPGKIRVSNCDA